MWDSLGPQGSLLITWTVRDPGEGPLPSQLPPPFRHFSGNCSPPCLYVLCSVTDAWKMAKTLASTWLLLLPHKQSVKAEARTMQIDLSSISASKNQPREGVTGPVWPRGQQESKTECYLFPSSLLVSCPPSCPCSQPSWKQR